MKRTGLIYILVAMIASISSDAYGVSPEAVYDMEQAKEICDDLPLEAVEGIWIYPEDNVAVLILNDRNDRRRSYATSYTMRVVESKDARLKPGDVIGKLIETPDAKTYKIDLFTEKRNQSWLNPVTCIATLGNEGDTFIFKKGASRLKGRLNFNLSRLLPGFWKMISAGITTNTGNTDLKAPVGMMKIYPSYDGNGSSRRRVRYL